MLTMIFVHILILRIFFNIKQHFKDIPWKEQQIENIKVFCSVIHLIALRAIIDLDLEERDNISKLLRP